MDHGQDGRDPFFLPAGLIFTYMTLSLVGFSGKFYLTSILFNETVPWPIVVGVLTIMGVGLQLSAITVAHLLIELGHRREGNWILTQVLGKRLY